MGPRRSVRIGLALIAAGVAFRFWQLIHTRPLWLDEAWLALNILRRPLQGFFVPLDDNQISPLGFLWSEWLMTRLAGSGELAFRLLPFVGGVVALIALWRLARRLLEPGPALLATGLAAFSPLLIRYSTEVKSYGLDALAAILLLHCTLDLAEPAATRSTWLRWALIAAFAALVSTPAPFIVGGCALALLLLPRFHRDPAAVLRLGVACAPAAFLFVFQFFTLNHSAETTTFMQDYWADRFLEHRLPDALLHVGRVAESLSLSMLFGRDARDAIPSWAQAALLLVPAAGALSLARRRPFVIVALLAPLGFALCAAVVHLWPLSSRLLLFAAPAVLVSVSAGLAALVRLAPSRARSPAFAAGATLLVALGARSAVADLRDPPDFAPLPAILADVQRRHGPDATVYLSASQGPSCTYYAGYHPGRARIAADTTVKACQLRDLRIVLGTWPRWTRRVRGPNGNVDSEIDSEWLTAERGKILQGATGELWMVLSGAGVPEVFRPALEQAGAVLVDTRRWSRTTVYQFQIPPGTPRN